MLTLKSRAFESGQPIPAKYTGEGQNTSPPLAWSEPPAGTEEFALICDDPDAPRDEPWVHWVLYKIPGDRRELAEGDKAGAVEGQTSWETVGYGGPMPPPGHGTHHYHFKLYALDQPLELGPGTTKEGVLEAMDGHILEQAELVGTYER